MGRKSFGAGHLTVWSGHWGHRSKLDRSKIHMRTTFSTAGNAFSFWQIQWPYRLRHQQQIDFSLPIPSTYLRRMRALGLAAAPRRRALVPFGRWAFFEGEVCGAAGGLVARLADGHFAELTAPQAAALLEQRAGEAPGAWGLHTPPPAAAGGGGAPGVPRGGAGGKAAGPSTAPPLRPPPPGPSPGAISAAGASPAAEAAPAPPPAADAAAGPGSRAPAFHVQVREAAAAGQGDSSPSRGGRAGPAPGAAEPKLRSKFAQEFARR